jgi:hypothetical protein
MQPTRVLPAVSVLSLISVEYGGWALLGFLTGRGQLGQFREQFFRAGHAHAGVLLVLSLVYFLHLDRTGYSDRVKWLAGSLLLAGIMAQSGGFFIHLGLGQANRSSLGTVVTRFGALLMRRRWSSWPWVYSGAAAGVSSTNGARDRDTHGSSAATLRQSACARPSPWSHTGA